MQRNLGDPRFANTDTYAQYLKNQFIQSNQIEQVYYPSLPSDVGTISTKGMFELEETYMVLADMNITICKQFNFHFGRPHQMNCFEMVWALEGGADFYLDHEKISMKEGDMLLHPPQVPYEFRMQEGTIGISFVLRTRYVKENYVKLFSESPVCLHFFEKVLKKEPGQNYLLLHAQVGKEKINSLTLNMMIEYLWGGKYQSDIMDRYFEMIVYQARKAAGSRIDTPECPSALEEYYNQILSYVKNNYRTATLEDISKEMNFSQQYISRIVRKIGAKSFHQLVEEERIRKVKECLRETSYNLEIVAELTGYASGSYLSKAFRKHEGCTVSEYRSRNGRW